MAIGIENRFRLVNSFIKQGDLFCNLGEHNKALESYVKAGNNYLAADDTYTEIFQDNMLKGIQYFSESNEIKDFASKLKDKFSKQMRKVSEEINSDIQDINNKKVSKKAEFLATIEKIDNVINAYEIVNELLEIDGDKAKIEKNSMKIECLKKCMQGIQARKRNRESIKEAVDIFDPSTRKSNGQSTESYLKELISQQGNWR